MTLSDVYLIGGEASAKQTANDVAFAGTYDDLNNTPVSRNFFSPD